MNSPSFPTLLIAGLLAASASLTWSATDEPPGDLAAELAPEPPLKPDITALLAQLQCDDLETRYEAMRQLGPSIDPRLPDACLTVLKKEGNSIRRLAARAIGSHWQQIPKDRVPVFTAALKIQLDSEVWGLLRLLHRWLDGRRTRVLSHDIGQARRGIHRL